MADDDQVLYNVYEFRIDSDAEPVLAAAGLYKFDAEKLAWEICERGPVWDSYIIEADHDAGPFMKKA